MLKVVLFGGSGLLGNAFIKTVNTNLVNLVSPTSRELDLFNNSAVTNFLNQHLDADIIINCTGYNFVDKAEEERDLCQKLNVDVPDFLTKCLQRQKFSGKFIQFSSDYVFDGNKSDGYIESDKTNPLNYYGVTKDQCEKVVLSNFQNSCVIRTSWLFGPGKMNFLSKILKFSLEAEPLKIVDNQFGKPTYTIDLARYILKNHNLLSHDTYHLINETIYSWRDFAIFFLKLTGYNKFILANQAPFNVMRPAVSILQNTKLPKLRNGSDAIIDYYNNYIAI